MIHSFLLDFLFQGFVIHFMIIQLPECGAHKPIIHPHCYTQIHTANNFLMWRHLFSFSSYILCLSDFLLEFFFLFVCLFFDDFSVLILLLCVLTAFSISTPVRLNVALNAHSARTFNAYIDLSKADGTNRIFNPFVFNLTRMRSY